MDTSTTMAKKKAGTQTPGVGRPVSQRDDASVKLDRRIVARARQVAMDKHLTIAEFLSEILRPHVDREWIRLMKKIEAERTES